MRFCERLRRDNDAVFSAARSHPFVRGIGDGSLPRTTFSRWIVQDWLYLQGYLGALESAAMHSPTPSAREFWSELKRLTLEEELSLHRRLAERFGLSIGDLDNAQPTTATEAYLHTLRVARTNYPTLVATLTPCAVSYADIGRELAAEGNCPEPDYADWITTYTDPAFTETIEVFERELDRCAERPEAVEPMEIAYGRAARHEVAFWDGLYDPVYPDITASGT